MDEIIIVLFIGLAGLTSTIISSLGDLYDAGKHKLYHRLTSRGKIVLLLGLIIIGLTIFQIISTNREKEMEKRERLAQESVRDSIVSAEIYKGVDANRKKLFADLSEALSKQKIQLDTVSKTVVALRDSAKNIILQSPEDYPILYLPQSGIQHKISNDTVQCTILFAISSASAKVAYVDVVAKFYYGNDVSLIKKKIRLLRGPAIVGKGMTFSTVLNSRDSEKIQKIVFFFSGRYSDIEEKRTIPIKIVSEYVLDLGTVTTFQPYFADSLFRKNNLQF